MSTTMSRTKKKEKARLPAGRGGGRPPTDDPDAVYINAEHAAGVAATRKGLEHYLNAGRRLLKKREEVLGGRRQG